MGNSETVRLFHPGLSLLQSGWAEDVLVQLHDSASPEIQGCRMQVEVKDFSKRENQTENYGS